MIKNTQGKTTKHNFQGFIDDNNKKSALKTFTNLIKKLIISAFT